MENKTAELAYWINEREAMRLRREKGVAAPWTTDPTMANVRYCNVHREDDKVTRYIRSSTVYSGADIPVWRVVLARMVNRISTLQALIPSASKGDLPGVKATMKHFRDGGTVIWGNAYTISTCGKSMDKVDYVVDHVVDAFKQVEEPDYTSLQDTFNQLTCVDGFGSFLAAQVIADLKNIPCHPLNRAPDWHTWSTHGPGSLKGLSAYFGRNITAGQYQAAIKQCYDETIPHVNSYVGHLHMQDFQNCLCEFSKYMRVKTGAGHARNSYVAG